MPAGNAARAKLSPKRYAQALFQLGLERSELGKWFQDLQAIAEALKAEEFRVFLEHEKVPLGSKLGLIEQTLSDVSPLTRNFLVLLASRRALDALPDVLAEYQQLLDEYYGRQRAVVVSAVPLDEAEEQRVQRFLVGLRNGKEVVLDARVDPSILGGLVIRLGSRLMDGSIRAKLETMRRSLAQEATQSAS